MRTPFALWFASILFMLHGTASVHAGRVVEFEILVEGKQVLVARTLDDGEFGPDELWDSLKRLPVRNPAKSYVLDETETKRLADFETQFERLADKNTVLLRGEIRVFCRYAGDVSVESLRFVRTDSRSDWFIDPKDVDAMAKTRTMDRTFRARERIVRNAVVNASSAEVSQENLALDNIQESGKFPGFSGYSRSVTCNRPEVQKWFDQGIQLLYGYNHDEAIRSFEKAAALDPSCAMAWWGSAYAHGLHINNPIMSDEQSRLAREAAEKALRALDDETPVERALVEAVVKRYEIPAPADRKPLDEAYANAMENTWHAFPNDPDVGALYAESLMTLQPWDLWTHSGQPKGRTLEMLAVINRTLDRYPNHPGANHFYIHCIEASPWPDLGVTSAERLTQLVPGSGHLVHMPAHIFIRVGRYHDAADANERAIAADEAYFAKAPEPDFYSLYYVHNLHFLAYAAMMEARLETALAAAQRIESEIPKDFLKKYVVVADGFMPTKLHVLIRFGKWDQILREASPDSWRLLSLAQWHYARSIALSNLGRLEESATELKHLEDVLPEMTEEWKMGNNPAADVLALSKRMAEGELAYHSGETDKAFQILRQAVELEERLTYDEPPGWMQPVRHALGALLLAEGKHEEAEAVYRADLLRHPNNAWSLLGLQQSLQKQGRGLEADTMTEQVKVAWSRSDIQPLASCYCHPDAKGH